MARVEIEEDGGLCCSGLQVSGQGVNVVLDGRVENLALYQVSRL